MDHDEYCAMTRQVRVGSVLSVGDRLSATDGRRYRVERVRWSTGGTLVVDLIDDEDQADDEHG